MSLWVECSDVPDGAQEVAVFSASSGQSFGNAQQMAERTPDIPWVSLESGNWKLDGKAALLEEADQIGWWSQCRSDSNREFSQPPVLTVSFPETLTATGITFRFWPSLNHWCSKIQVSWYNGSDLLLTKTAFPTGPDWFLEQSVGDFDKIEITLLKTNQPGQFAKIQQLQIGQVAMFMGNELVRVRLLNEMDPSLCTLRVDSMHIEIHDRKKHCLLPKRNQTVRLYRNGKLQATHYITDAVREEKQRYIFRCQSAIGRLERYFPGGTYQEEPVTNLLDRVLADFPYMLDAYFDHETVTGILPRCTRREALQQIAFALGAAVTTREDGIIYLSPLETGAADSFNEHSVFVGSRAGQKPQIAAVQLVAHGLNGERELHTKENPYVTTAERSNVIRVEDAVFVHEGNVEQVLNRLYDYYINRQVLTQRVVVSGQKAGQMIQSLNPWGTVTEGYITSMESEFTRTGHTAQITVLGVEKLKEVLS